MTYNTTSAVFHADYSTDSVTASDSRTYTCIVTNPIGSYSTVIIVVISKLLISDVAVCKNNSMFGGWKQVHHHNIKIINLCNMFLSSFDNAHLYCFVGGLIFCVLMLCTKINYFYKSAILYI